MKHHAVRYFLFWVAAGVAGAQIAAAADPLVEELRRQWEATRNQIVQAAEAVPEDKYDFRPTAEVRTFRELLIHILDENHMFMGIVAGRGGQSDPSRFDNLRSRSEVLRALSESYDYGAQVLAGLNDQKAMEAIPFQRGQPVPRWAVVLANMKDNHEHYGNLVTYLRLNGIVPPRTAARQRGRS